jgi:hypothetical protein
MLELLSMTPTQDIHDEWRERYRPRTAAVFGSFVRIIPAVVSTERRTARGRHRGRCRASADPEALPREVQCQR